MNRTSPALGELEFRELADFAPVMIWRSGPDKLCDWFNQPWLDFTGRPMEQELGNGWAEGVHPDDLDRCLSIYIGAFDARRPFSMEYRLRRHDGIYRWLLDNGAPFERHGAFRGYFGSCIDISEQKDLQHRQQLLINELNHRVRNTLATVQAIAAQSFRDQDAGPALALFDSRIHALSGAHDALSEEQWRGADLAQLVDKVITPFGDQHRNRIHADGPSVRQSPRAAVAIAMALNELCTNATRHGALSAPDGTVRIDWRVDGAAAPQVRLVWREIGGPPAAPPARKGFGMRLIERQLARELQGEVEVEYRPEGLLCTIRAPLAMPPSEFDDGSAPAPGR